MIQALLAAAVAALITSVLCIGIPVALAMRFDARRARAMGIAPRTIIRQRLRLTTTPPAAGDAVYLECWTLGCAMRTRGTVVSSNDSEVQIDTEQGRVVFERGAIIHASGERGRGMLIAV